MEQRAWTLTRWSPEMRALDSAPHHRLLERWSSNPTLRMRLQRTGLPSAAGHLHAREQSERMARNAEEPLASLPKLCGVILRGWVRARTHCSRPTRILVASPFSAAPREDLTAHGGVEVQGLACRRTPGRGFDQYPTTVSLSLLAWRDSRSISAVTLRCGISAERDPEESSRTARPSAEVGMTGHLKISYELDWQNDVPKIGLKPGRKCPKWA